MEDENPSKEAGQENSLNLRSCQNVCVRERMTRLDEKVTAVKWNYLNLRTKLDLPWASKARSGAPMWITF